MLSQDTILFVYFECLSCFQLKLSVCRPSMFWKSFLMPSDLLQSGLQACRKPFTFHLEISLHCHPGGSLPASFLSHLIPRIPWPPVCAITSGDYTLQQLPDKVWGSDFLRCADTSVAYKTIEFKIISLSKFYSNVLQILVLRLRSPVLFSFKQNLFSYSQCL